jgi:chromate reductase, NAD(P)H dehydrogenase (quinone)
MHIGVMVGSLRKESYNRKIYNALTLLAPAEAMFTEIPIGNLPLFNEDIEKPLPAEVQTFKEAISEKDAILFVSPEYNRSIPGVLKNAIDWSTRGGSYALDKKPGAVIGATSGRLGTVAMQAHMHNVMLHVGMRVIGQPEVYIAHAGKLFAEDGTLTDTKTKEILTQFIDRFISQVTTH